MVIIMGGQTQLEQQEQKLKGDLFIGNNGLVKINADNQDYYMLFKSRNEAINFLASDKIYTLSKENIPINFLNEIKSQISENKNVSTLNINYSEVQKSSPIEIVGNKFTKNTFAWLEQEIEKGNITDIDKFIKDAKMTKNSKGEYFITSTQIAKYRNKEEKPLNAITQLEKEEKSPSPEIKTEKVTDIVKNQIKEGTKLQQSLESVGFSKALAAIYSGASKEKVTSEIRKAEQMAKVKREERVKLAKSKDKEKIIEEAKEKQVKVTQETKKEMSEEEIEEIDKYEEAFNLTTQEQKNREKKAVKTENKEQAKEVKKEDKKKEDKKEEEEEKKANVIDDVDI